MNYEEAVSFIEQSPRFSPGASLPNVKKLLSLLGHPDKKMRIFHVAGTNGKGSVCAFLDAMLREHGCRTGLFTSPHLVKMNERFRIGGKPVCDAAFLYAFQKVKETWETAEADIPTYFEILFLMGMVIFQEEKTDAVILETGLGGRLDATNAVSTAAACIITSVSRDHMAYLGNDVRDIAAEKAGIMKPGVPCFYIDRDQAVSEVLSGYARRIGCRAYPVSPGYASEKIKIRSKGIYQRENAALAYFALRHTPAFDIPDTVLISGLAKAVWPGRMEEAAPDVFLDGAHNEDGIRRFLESAQEIARQRDTVLLFSAVRDKEYKKMAAQLAAGLQPVCVVTTEVSTERAAAAADLAAEFEAAGCRNVCAVKGVKEALRIALEEKKDAVLFCVGSLYLIGELKKELSDAEL